MDVFLREVWINQKRDTILKFSWEVIMLVPRLSKGLVIGAAEDDRLGHLDFLTIRLVEFDILLTIGHTVKRPQQHAQIAVDQILNNLPPRCRHLHKFRHYHYENDATVHSETMDRWALPWTYRHIRELLEELKFEQQEKTKLLNYSESRIRNAGNSPQWGWSDKDASDQTQSATSCLKYDSVGGYVKIWIYSDGLQWVKIVKWFHDEYVLAWSWPSIFDIALKEISVSTGGPSTSSSERTTFCYHCSALHTALVILTPWLREFACFEGELTACSEGHRYHYTFVEVLTEICGQFTVQCHCVLIAEKQAAYENAQSTFWKTCTGTFKLCTLD